MPKQIDNIIMKDATILFRNFAGREGRFNSEGDRNFCVVLEPGLAEALARDGWNVKQLPPREEGAEPLNILKVSVKFRGRTGVATRPPTIVMITSRGRTSLSEDESEILDWVDIREIDLIIRPYEWAVNGSTGISAYLKAIYVTIEEDELQLKYADVPEIGSEERQALTTGDDAIDVEFWEVDEKQKTIGR